MYRYSFALSTSYRALVPALLLVLAACHTRPANSPPAIVFDKVPKADAGGPNKLDAVEGHVVGLQPGQQIVLYALSQDLWWVQPFSDRPYTTVGKGSRWASQIHLGTKYAALVVNQGYKPPQTTETLPAVGPGIAAVTVADGVGETPAKPPDKILHFSGYDWIARSAASYRGGSFIVFIPENAWTDERGALHLRMTRRPPDWGGAEVKLTRSLGYGTYRFTVRDISHMEPEATLSLFTWDGVGTEDNRRELDLELGRWGFQNNDNAQYVVQPYYVPLNIVRFKAPGGVLTHSLHWEPGRATFQTVLGSGETAKPQVVQKHVFNAGVPTSGGENVRINLYPFLKGQVPLKNEDEIVIDKFEYLP